MIEVELNRVGIGETMSGTVGNSEDRTDGGDQWLDSIDLNEPTDTWIPSQSDLVKST